jgi:hypothetical protein
MLKVIEEQKEIENALDMLESVLEKIADEKIPVKIGYRGGNVADEVSYSSKLNIWFYFGGPIEGNAKDKRERYWNVFGTEKPMMNSSIPIVVEINPPVKGIYRRVAGAFAKDEKGNIFLLHRGRIGGGREGIGATLFNKFYDGEIVDVEDGDEISKMAVLGNITSLDLSEKISTFIHKVKEIKDMK